PTLAGVPLEPMRPPQLLGGCHSKRADRTRAVAFLPHHRALLVATVSQRTRRRPELRRPNRVEGRDEFGHSLQRRRDHALVLVADPHRITWRSPPGAGPRGPGSVA